MLILGLNLFHSDSSAAILVDGELRFAIAEERLNRVKHCGSFPRLAIQACLDAVGARLEEVDHVAIGRSTRANLAQKVQYALKDPTRALNFIRMRARTQATEDLRSLIGAELQVDRQALRFQEHPIEHHLCHIASAFLCSDFDQAAGFSYDGSGDFVSTMFARCQGSRIEPVRRVFVPHSLGYLYTAGSQFIGYHSYGDEGKVMGLAPYGRPTFVEEMGRIAVSTPDGFELAPEYFVPLGADQGLRIEADGTVTCPPLFTRRWEERFGEAKPRPEPGGARAAVTQRDMDVAFALQQRFQEVAFHLWHGLHRAVPSPNLAMAGGCALNSVANGLLFDQTPFERTWIQPAAGDDGLSVGAALYVYHCVLGHPRRYRMRDAYLGPEYSEAECRRALESARVPYRRLEREALIAFAADRIAAGQVVGWFQGRMEYGPRALGNRSILAHPGRPDMKEILNARVKHREWFRPFAPSVLEDAQGEYFEHSHPSPFMLHVFKIRPEHREECRAVNHVDDTGRLQTVNREENPLYYDLIAAFRDRTGTPMVLNTSFNENEPIVCRPQEAVDCFTRTRMDALCLGPFVAEKLMGCGDDGVRG
jgi:carbamoyltransferase